MVSQQNQPFCPLRAQTMFESVQEHFEDLRHVKRGRTYVSGLNALYWRTKFAKMVSQRNQPFHRIRPQTIFENVQEHFEDLRHVERGRTCFSSLNALYWGTEVAKMVSQRNQPLHPIRSQTMVENVQEYFEGLRHVKRGRTCVSRLNALYRVPELRKWFLNKINHSVP